MSFEKRSTLLLILTALAVTCIFTKLSVGYLPSYDDGYYAQKAREFSSLGDWLTPHIGGRTRFDNPPGYLWTIAASYKIFGVDEFAARYSSALAGLLGILGTFFLFELLLSTRVGFLAALILNLTTVYLKYARHSMMDVTVAAAGVWSSYFFVRALRGRPALFLLAGLIGSYVPLAKSVFGVAPPAIFFFYLVATRQMAALRRWQLWAGLGLYLAPYLAWCTYEYGVFGHQFLEAHFINLIFNLATHGGADDHHYDYVLVLTKYFPIYLPFMLMGMWTAGRARGEDRRGQWFGLIYFLTYFVFLSAQNTTKTWYFISALPACAGLAAVGLDRALARYSLERISRFVAGLTFAIYLVIQMTPVMLSNERAVDTKRLSPFVRAAAEQGFEVYYLQNDYFGLNASMLFYSDHAAALLKEAEIAPLLASGKKVAVIFDTPDWDRLRGGLTGLTPVRISTKLMLSSSAPIAQERIF